MTQNTAVTTLNPPNNKPSLVQKIADRYNVDGDKMLHTLKATAFQSSEQITNEQMMALLIVADQYGLNPFTKEIYAFPDKKGIVPVVGVDGWSRIINENSNFDGMEFNQSENMIVSEANEHKPVPEWIECVMYRKDRKHPIKVKEYFDEVYRAPFVKNKGRTNESKIDGAWQSHTKRFLRHKTMIQTARIAFGFVGIYDQDEAERIIEAEVVRVDDHAVPETEKQVTSEPATRTSSVSDKLKKRAEEIQQNNKPVKADNQESAEAETGASE